MKRRITIVYDARPFASTVEKFNAEIIKELKTGFKVKNLDEPGRYEDVVFTRNGGAKGWNTLSWF